jgi:hypothetical protein
MDTWKGIVGRGFSAEAFDAYVFSLTFMGWTPQFVVLHNTADPTLAHWHDVPGDSRMRGLEDYYRDTQKWSAGPHLFVADDLIWVFTPVTTSGVHSPSWNSISWGVELVGDYSVEPLSAQVRQNATAALATLHRVAQLDPSTLRLHKEDPLTTHKGCPGDNIVKADVISWVQGALADKAND